MKVLLCEGDPTVALDLWWLLHEQGHHVCGIVRDGAKLLPKAEQTRPDLVMLAGEACDARSGLSLGDTLARSGFAYVLVSRDATASSGRTVLRKPFTQACLATAMARAERAMQPLMGGAARP